MYEFNKNETQETIFLGITMHTICVTLYDGVEQLPCTLALAGKFDALYTLVPLDYKSRVSSGTKRTTVAVGNKSNSIDSAAFLEVSRTDYSSCYYKSNDINSHNKRIKLT